VSRSRYRTAPAASRELPSGIPYIVGNEAAERFSFYGMRAILVVFMTTHLLGADGSAAPMTDAEARSYYHLFSSAVYFFPFLGALLSDGVLGKYRTIVALSVVYCLGHLALAVDDSRLGLAAGLSLIAVGSGGIKPCVSAHVGDQFGSTNQHLLPKVFGWFYFAINLGAFISSLLTPWLLERVGPRVAFGVPGVLMLTATVVFWLGRHRFVHVPPSGMGFVREALGAEGRGALTRLAVLYAFVAVFWSLYDQTGSAWVLQARNMDRHFLGIEWLPSQIQAVNPILILVFIPVFSYGVYPMTERWFRVTPLRKIGVGLFLTVTSFLVSAWIESRIQLGVLPNISWQLFAYVVLTAAEVLVSITCLEFSYTQAPRRTKSLVMALFFMSVSVGNLFTSAVNFVIEGRHGAAGLEGADYYLFFAAVMSVTALGFVAVAARFRETTYMQIEDGEPSP
jgi:POT family proton-dependent oligopeptide transporter